MAEVTLQQLFTPGKIGGVSIPNRIVCTSMVTNYCDDGRRIASWTTSRRRPGAATV
ncbi:hypothetical protein [Aminiphilus circumscriptus]|jgi:2,4-dienoyl-CoA reductase-like NADH-dependent reductase (Old Yellow Enzyme family)|uniref:hypothetical protein n=1 Tax=Aminiphilus circumscriptus TaxID=290732 RepID=UPI0004ADFF6D|nr:hypothetical protein [Aminiphilus circumscriptus]